MSDISYAVQLTYDKNGRSLQVPATAITASLTNAGLTSGVILVTTASAMALPTSGITSPGLCIFKNLDATNSIIIGIDDTGLVTHDVIPAGGQVVRHMNGETPYAQANVADALLSYTIVDQ